MNGNIPQVLQEGTFQSTLGQFYAARAASFAILPPTAHHFHTPTATAPTQPHPPVPQASSLVGVTARLPIVAEAADVQVRD